MPHPLVFDCHVKVQTVDRNTTPTVAFGAALEDLKIEVDRIQERFKSAVVKFETESSNF